MFQTDFPLSHVLYQFSPSLGFCLGPWEAAMGSCFHFEVMVRLLAQKFFAGESVTCDIADHRKAPGLLTRLFDRLPFDDKEQRLLRNCNTLRNKLIHCEPDAVLKVIQELEPSFRPPNIVQELTIEPDANGDEIVEVIATRRGAVNVQARSSREDGFLGWMMQSANDGTFHAAVEIFREGVFVLNSKAMAPERCPAEGASE